MLKPPFSICTYFFINNGIDSSKPYGKRYNFSFEMENFPFQDGDVPRFHSYGVFVSSLFCITRVCSSVSGIINRNRFMTAKLLEQG